MVTRGVTVSVRRDGSTYHTEVSPYSAGSMDQDGAIVIQVLVLNRTDDKAVRTAKDIVRTLARERDIPFIHGLDEPDTITVPATDPVADAFASANAETKW